MVTTTTHDEIELLTVDLLNDPRAQEFRTLGGILDIQIGWHYLLDFTWAANRMYGTQILDAGAGIGLMQFWLAHNCANVISVDRDVRTIPPRMHGLAHITGDFKEKRWQRLLRACAGAPLFLDSVDVPKKKGTITMVTADLGELPIESESVDCVVAISSLEHNRAANLPGVVEELMRVIKPGGKLIATLGAASSKDWFHEPSQGWCYTAGTLGRAFDIDPSVAVGFDRYDETLARLRDNTELRENLAPFYFKRNNTGMPGGVWDPRYQPAGIVKHKPQNC